MPNENGTLVFLLLRKVKYLLRLESVVGAEVR